MNWINKEETKNHYKAAAAIYLFAPLLLHVFKKMSITSLIIITTTLALLIEKLKLGFGFLEICSAPPAVTFIGTTVESWAIYGFLVTFI